MYVIVARYIIQSPASIQCRIMDAAKFKYNYQKCQNVHNPDTPEQTVKKKEWFMYVRVQEIHGVREKLAEYDLE